MPSASEFGVASVQVSLFSPDIGTFSQIRVLGYLVAQHQVVFDGPVTSLPLPAEAPPQLPRVIMQSTDGTWRLSAAPARIDVFWNPQDRLYSLADTMPFITQCSDIVAEFAVQHPDTRIGRLAFVVHSGVVISAPAQELIRLFCNERVQAGPLTDSQAFELHNLKRYQPAGMPTMINSWVRCRTAEIREQPAIAVEQDLNTPQEQLATMRFTSDHIRAFCAFATNEVSDLLGLYFPDGA
jgi:hypothetical protein